MKVRECVVHGLQIHLDDFVAFLAVGFFDGIFDRVNRLVLGQHAGERKEADLHDGVDASAHAAVARDFGGVDHEKFCLLGEQALLHRRRQLGPDFVLAKRRVEQERSARHQAAQHFVAVQKFRQMARDEIGARNQIRRTNRLRTEAQMRNRHRAGFLRVINEIALRVIVRFLADDLDGIFVRADRAVCAEAVKQRAHHFVGLGGKFRVILEARMRDIIVDADGEMILRRGHGQIVEHGLDHRRREFFRRQTVAAGEDGGNRFQMRAAGGRFLHQSRDAILIQRLARRARFLRSVEHRDFTDGCRQRFHKAFAVERTIQPHFDHADFFAVMVQIFHRFIGGFAAGTHQHDDAFRIRRADVVEQLVFAAGLHGEFIHDFLDDVGTRGIKTVRGFAALEKHVGILCRAAEDRLVRRHGAGTMLGD